MVNDANSSDLLPGPLRHVQQEQAAALLFNPSDIVATGESSATVAGVAVDISCQGDWELVDGCGQMAETRLVCRHYLGARSKCPTWVSAPLDSAELRIARKPVLYCLWNKQCVTA